MPAYFTLAILVVGLILGALARLIVPGNQRITWSETILVGIAGAGFGGLVGNYLTPDAEAMALLPRTWIGSLVGSVLVLLAVIGVMKWLGLRPDEDAPRLTVAELIAEGESHSLEFKQTGRWNIHSEAKDPKIEIVIAKTIAGFLNAGGGTLLIGVSDDGVATGLDSDLALMKEPDLDRYELWLTDFLERCLGKPAVANVRVTFEFVAKVQVCRVDVQPAPAPVFLDEPGGDRRADVYVRMGNSTRKLLTDEAMEYADSHWK